MVVPIQIYETVKIFNILGPKTFVLIAIMFIAYQVYSPNVLPNTKFQEIIGRFENQIGEIQENVSTKLDRFEEKQLAHIQITRAIASVENPAEEINEDIVDDYLIQNGIDKNDFLLGDAAEEPRFDHLTDDEVEQLMKRLDDSRNDENNSVDGRLKK